MGSLIFFAIVIGYFVYRKAQDSPEVRSRSKYCSKDNKMALRYFHNDGMLQKKPSDEEYDSFVNYLIHKDNLSDYHTALERLGLDESEVTEVQPILLEGYVIGHGYQKIGKDGNRRSSIYQVTWIFCTSEQVMLYRYTFNTDIDDFKVEADEYFYKDITNILIVSETDRANDKYTRFRLTFPGGTMNCAMERTKKTEAAIAGLKTKIREKKNLS